VLKPAGLDASRGIISVNYGKDPDDPTWDNDPGMKRWRAFMDKYYPEGDKHSNLNSYGYGNAQTLVNLLRACGDNLTRENVMAQLANIKDFEFDLLLPGISIYSSPTDYRGIRQLQMIRFNGERWEGFGPIISDDYKGG
jgi:branched-chain amino acid transport system substrate-binding protein